MIVFQIFTWMIDSSASIKPLIGLCLKEFQSFCLANGPKPILDVTAG
jgi:hypothetical protein